MQKINKTAQLLEVIDQKKILSLVQLTKNPSLVAQFTSTSTTPQRRITDTAVLLAKKGYLSVGTLDGEKVFRLTQKGRQRIRSVSTLEVTMPTTYAPARWYLVTFDIPESKKVVRNQLILVLKRYGFMNYTKGVWITPYNPAVLVKKLKQVYDLKKELKLIVTSYIDNDSLYKKKFGLN